MNAIMMGSRATAAAAFVLFCVLLIAGAPAVADSHDTQAVSLDDAIALVRQKSGGKVLRAETKRQNDHSAHEIRVLTDDGHVRTYVVDGRNGKIREK